MARSFAFQFVEKAQALLPGEAAIPETGRNPLFSAEILAETAATSIFYHFRVWNSPENTFSSLSGFHLAPQTGLFQPFPGTGSPKNGLSGKVGGSPVAKSLVFCLFPDSDLLHKRIFSPCGDFF